LCLAPLSVTSWELNQKVENATFNNYSEDFPLFEAKRTADKNVFFFFLIIEQNSIYVVFGVAGTDPTADLAPGDFDFNPCPSDSRRTTNKNGDTECVCEPCSMLECQGNILPTKLREVSGVPGKCCPEYVCPPVPGE